MKAPRIEPNVDVASGPAQFGTEHVHRRRLAAAPGTVERDGDRALSVLVVEDSDQPLEQQSLAVVRASFLREGHVRQHDISYRAVLGYFSFLCLALSPT